MQFAKLLTSRFLTLLILLSITFSKSLQKYQKRNILLKVKVEEF